MRSWLFHLKLTLLIIIIAGNGNMIVRPWQCNLLGIDSRLWFIESISNIPNNIPTESYYNNSYNNNSKKQKSADCLYMPLQGYDYTIDVNWSSISYDITTNVHSNQVNLPSSYFKLPVKSVIRYRYAISTINESMKTAKFNMYYSFVIINSFFFFNF